MAGEFFEAAKAFPSSGDFMGAVRARMQGICAEAVISQMLWNPDRAPTSFGSGQALEKYEDLRRAGAEDIPLWEAEGELVRLFGRSVGAVYDEWKGFEPRRRSAVLRGEIHGLNAGLRDLAYNIPPGLSQFDASAVPLEDISQERQLAQQVSPAAFWSHNIHGRVSGAVILREMVGQTGIADGGLALIRGQSRTLLLTQERVRVGSLTELESCSAYLKAANAFQWNDSDVEADKLLAGLADLTGKLAANYRALEGIERLGSN